LVESDIRTIALDTFRGVDSVVNLAGISNDPAADLSPELTRSINFDGCVRVARLAKEAGVSRFIEMSSCSVYGAAEGVCTEEFSTNPLSLYAQMKVDVEEETMSLADGDFALTALRNSTAFGLSDRMRFDLVVNIMTLCGVRDRVIKIFGDGLQRRPLIHTADVAETCLQLIEEDPQKLSGEVYNLGAMSLNMKEVAQKVCKGVKAKLGETVEVVQIPEEADARDYEVSFDKFERTFEFRPSRTIEWAVDEIVEALQGGTLVPDRTCYTVSFYKSLIESYGSTLL